MTDLTDGQSALFDVLVHLLGPRRTSRFVATCGSRSWSIHLFDPETGSYVYQSMPSLTEADLLALQGAARIRLAPVGPGALVYVGSLETPVSPESKQICL